MEKYTRKDFEKMLRDYVATHKPSNLKKQAIEELDELDAKGIRIPHCATIVHEYEDFDHFRLKLGRSGKNAGECLTAIFCLGYALAKQFEDKDYKLVAKELYALYRTFALGK